MSSPLQNLSTTTVPSKYSFLQNLAIGLDVLLMAVWILTAVFYAFSVGRRRAPILLLSTYAGLAVVTVVSQLGAFGFLSGIQQNESFFLYTFLLSSILAFVALLRVIRPHQKRVFKKNGLMLLGSLEMGAFFASVGSLLPTELQRQITGFAAVLFTLPWTHILWLLLPLIIFLITEQKHRSPTVTT